MITTPTKQPYLVLTHFISFDCVFKVFLLFLLYFFLLHLCISASAGGPPKLVAKHRSKAANKLTPTGAPTPAPHVHTASLGWRGCGGSLHRGHDLKSACNKFTHTHTVSYALVHKFARTCRLYIVALTVAAVRFFLLLHFERHSGMLLQQQCEQQPTASYQQQREAVFQRHCVCYAVC